MAVSWAHGVTTPQSSLSNTTPCGVIIIIITIIIIINNWMLMYYIRGCKSPMTDHHENLHMVFLLSVMW